MRPHPILLAVGLFAAPAWAICPVVSTTADTAPDSLRDCITQANATAGKQTITFDPTVFNPGTITLASNLPALTDPAGTAINGGSAANVTIDGAGFTPGYGLILIGNENEVRHLTLRNFRGASSFIEGSAIWINTGSSGNVIANSVLIDNQGCGIELDGDSVRTTISDNLIQSCAQFGIRIGGGTATCLTKNVVTRNRLVANGAASGDGLFVLGNDCLEVSSNTFDSQDAGFALRLGLASTRSSVIRNEFIGNSDAIGVFSGSNNNRISFNRIVDTRGTAISIGDPGSANNVVEGNLVIRTRLQGNISVGAYVSAGGDGTLILQNTFHAGEGLAARVDTGVLGVRILNNIFSEHAKVALQLVEPSVELSYNAFFRNDGGDCQACTIGPGNIGRDPGFVAPVAPTDDYRLGRCDGGVVDQGLDLGANQPDLTPEGDGLKFFGLAPDLGGLEAQCGSAPDSGVDAGRDAGVDTGRDAGADGGLDAGAGPDAGVPGFSSVPGLAAVCGLRYPYSSDNLAHLDRAERVIWSLGATPKGFAINPFSGEVSWIPTAAQAGRHPVTVLAVTQNGTAEQSFVVDVDCAPRVLTTGCGCAASDGAALAALLVGLRALIRKRWGSRGA